MLKQITLSFLCFFVITAVSQARLCAQTPADSTGNKTDAYITTTDKFYLSIGGQSRLFNGVEYDDYYHGINGSAFFMDAPDWNTGSISYDGFTYKNVRMRYDLYRDVLVIPLYQSYIKISLLNDKLTSFNLLGHHFISLRIDPAAPGPVKSGIYDVLYSSDRLKLLCKRNKNIQQNQNVGEIISYFIPTVDYYVFKDNQYYTVNSKDEFLDVFKDKNKDIRRFISTNKLKFKKDTKEQAMARVAEYYDHLTN